MSEQEFEEFRRSMSLAQAALRAATERDDARRKAKAADEPDEDASLHHYRFK